MTVQPLDAPDSTALPADQTTLPRTSLLSAFSVRDFRLVWAGENISLLGDQFYMVALPWLTLQLTGSGLALGAVAAAAGIPRAVFMLIGGAITDRFSPRSVMFVSNALRVILTLLITALVLTHTIQFWMLFLTALVFGLVDAFFFPASSAIVPMIVQKEHIESGNALMQITAQLANFVGPALAGLIIASISGLSNLQAIETSAASGDVRGISLAIGLDAITFIVAAIALWMMKGGRTVVKQEHKQGVVASIAEGLHLVWGDPILRVMIILISAINFFFTGPMGVGIPVLAKHLPEGAAAFGAILSAFGGGALVGAILGGTLPTPRRLGVVAMSSIAVAGAGLGLFGIVSNLWVGVAAAIIMGLMVGYTNVVTISWLQKRTPAEKMGRVMSLVMLGSFGLGPISNFVAGTLVDNHLTLMFGVAGGLLVIMSLASLFKREVRYMGS